MNKLHFGIYNLDYSINCIKLSFYVLGLLIKTKLLTKWGPRQMPRSPFGSKGTFINEFFNNSVTICNITNDRRNKLKFFFLLFKRCVRQ